MTPFNVGVLLFDQAELLDFAGPIQVFSALHYVHPELCNPVITIGLSSEIQVAKLGMKIIPDCTLDAYTGALDVLFIPGGFGTRSLLKDEQTLQSISVLADRAVRLATVCTGSLVAAKLGLLQGLRATTHYLATDILTEIDPTIIVDRSKRYFDHDTLLISEGVSAGIDMSFYMIEKYFGQEKSDDVRKYIEYYPSK